MTTHRAQVTILHAELDEEEVPEGFKFASKSDVCPPAGAEGGGGGEKRSATVRFARPAARFSARARLMTERFAGGERRGGRK